MTDTLTNESLILDSLTVEDLEPPCQSPHGCDNSATFVVEIVTSCDCEQPWLACELHEKILRTNWEKGLFSLYPTRCSKCLGFVTLDDFRSEPLKR